MRLNLKTLTAAALIPLLTACNDNLGLCPPDYCLIPAFSATSEMTPDTKNLAGEYRDGAYPVLWSAGDRLAITGDPSIEAASWFSTADDSTSTATFKYDDSITGNAIPSYRGRMWLAFFPADSYSFAGGEHIMRLQKEQTYSPDSFGNGAMPMFSSSADRNLQFRNLCGIFRLRVSALNEMTDVTAINVKSSTPISGTLIYSQDSDSFRFKASGQSETIRLVCPGVQINSSPTDFCIVLPSGTYEDLTIQLISGNGTSKAFRMNTPLLIERSGITTVSLDLSQFTDTGTDDIAKGEDNSAVTKLEYEFNGPAPNIWIMRKKMTGSIHLRSWRSTEYSNGDSSSEDVPWNALFSIDGGASWTPEIPSLFKEFTVSGNGSPDGETLTYTAMPEKTGTTCIVRLVQEVSRKEITVNFSWRNNVIEATYETPTEYLNLFNMIDGNIDYVLSDTGKEFKVRTTAGGFLIKPIGSGLQKFLISVRDGSKTLNGLFSNNRNLTALDFSNADLSGIEDMSSLCYYANSLKEFKINFREQDTKTLNNVSKMFCGCNKLEEIDLTGIDTGNVTDMSSWFAFCSSLRELDVRDLNTSKVSNMNSLFLSCESLETLDISEFKTNDVNNMAFMFNSCYSLQSIIGISGLNTSSVTDIRRMFYDCRSLNSLDVSRFNTGQCRSMEGMFYSCRRLTELDVSGFSTENVTNMSNMFSGCTSLERLDVSRFRTDNVSDMSMMFRACGKLQAIDLSGFSFKSLKNASEMFYSAGIQEIEIPHFKAPLLKDAKRMFYQSGVKSIRISDFCCGSGCKLDRMFSCSNLKNLMLEDFDASNATSMNSMFMECTELESLDLSGMTTGSVTDMNSMFFNSSKLKTLTMDGITTSEVTDMGFMFTGCVALKRLDLSSFDTRKVTKMPLMFSNCVSLEELNLSSFRTPSLTNMSSMFYRCVSLRSIDMSSFSTENVQFFSELFYNCRSLTYLDLSGFSGKSARAAGSMFRGCTNIISIDIRNMCLENLLPEKTSSSNIDGAQRMFEECRSLKTLYMDLTGEAGYSVSNMFNQVTGPLELYVKDGRIDEKVRKELPAQCSIIPL